MPNSVWVRSCQGMGVEKVRKDDMARTMSMSGDALDNVFMSLVLSRIKYCIAGIFCERFILTDLVN